jgi:hypothetical protein
MKALTTALVALAIIAGIALGGAAGYLLADGQEPHRITTTVTETTEPVASSGTSDDGYTHEIYGDDGARGYTHEIRKQP